jgi:GNAT superfamily N-acetyltransferase
MWQHDRFVLCQLHDAISPHVRTAREHVPVKWTGINGFARPDDAELRLQLSAYGYYLRDRGDDGLLACDEEGELVGWVWVRVGPYRERVGCGYLDIPHNARVVRDFKVRPDLRGRGLGHQLLAKLRARLPIDETLMTIAFAEPNNAPSLTCLTASGFVQATTAGTRRIAGLRLTGVLPAL